MDCFGELSNNSPQRVVHKVNKWICLETKFSYMAQACERELVGTRGIGLGM